MRTIVRAALLLLAGLLAAPSPLYAGTPMAKKEACDRVVAIRSYIATGAGLLTVLERRYKGELSDETYAALVHNIWNDVSQDSVKIMSAMANSDNQEDKDAALAIYNTLDTRTTVCKNKVTDIETAVSIGWDQHRREFIAVCAAPLRKLWLAHCGTVDPLEGDVSVQATEPQAASPQP